MSQEIYYTPASDLAHMIRSKVLSPVEVVQAHLDRIDALNSKLNAIVIFAADPLGQAREAEVDIMRGDNAGPLHGVPYTLKDCVQVVGMRTTLGSRLFTEYVSKQDATIYTRLRDAGGILLGKTNMPEFALWWQTDNLLWGQTPNPWNPELTSGGSSGGEASAIACGLSPLGVGTDVGGSIRQPAAFCGLAGLKPTLGRVPYTGILPQTLLRAIHVGPMARTVNDVALELSVTARSDGLDVFAPPVSVPDYLDLDQPLTDLKVGWSPTMGIPVESEVQQTVARGAEALKDAGMSVEQTEIPAILEHDSSNISSVVYLTEGKQALTSIVQGRESELTPLLRSRYIESPPQKFQTYLEANSSWDLLKQGVADWFTRYDLFLCPTVPMPAYPHDQRELTIEGQTLASRHSLSATVPWDLTGSPAMSVPFGMSSDGLPIGVQLVGRHFDELTVLRAAKALEDRAGGYRRPPVD